MIDAALPTPADFAPPPTAAHRRRWREADAAARPARVARLRARFEAAGIDAYFGLRRENVRYLTGFVLGDGEERVAGSSGHFLISGGEVLVLADSRYTIQARAQAPEARIVDGPRELAPAWAALVGSVGARRVGVEAAVLPTAVWRRLEAAAPDVELVPIEGWVEEDRAIKEPAELERVAAACAIADRALAGLLPSIKRGATEAALALDLEWTMRTGGAEAVAFEPTCLVGPNAALPHGSPTASAKVRSGAVVLFDFGARVDGYRSDMTRTLFIGEPSERDLAIYELVARAQAAAIAQIEATVSGELEQPSGRDLHQIARRLIEADGRFPPFEHGLGHGIGLATHERPSLTATSLDTALPTPTVFSVEPGIYLEGETGVRIEDLLLLDADAGRVERLTQFPRDVVVLPG
jgi:Xaa-Pro aminopeptidase